MNNVIKDLPTEIVCELVAGGGAVLAAIIAYLTARTTTKKELKKMKMQWERNDAQSIKADFEEVASSVSKYIQSGWPSHQRDALQKISKLQMAGSEEMFDALESLRTSILYGPKGSIEQRLNAVIKLNRHEPNRKK